MDLNHAALFIDNLERSILPKAFGGWCGDLITISEAPAIVDGKPTSHSGRTRRLRTAAAPVFPVAVEDVVEGAPIQPVPGHAWHHMAIWCDNLADTVSALEKQGYEREIVGRDEDGNLSIFAYMKSARGPRLEVADPSIREMMDNRFAQETAQMPPISAGTGPGVPLAPCEAATVVGSNEELEALKSAWSAALGTQWGDVVDTATPVWTPAGERVLRARSVSSTGDPRVTIIAPDADSKDLIAPVADSGWHHVTFRSADLVADTAWFEDSGLHLEYSDRGPDGQPQNFAMLRTPDGTYVMLKKA